MSDVHEFLQDAAPTERHPDFKFDTVGKSIVGPIVSTPRTVQTTDMDGQKVTKLVIDLETPDGVFAVWVKKGRMSKAISDAMKTADATELVEGGTLALKYTGDGEKTQPAFNPPKLFAAKYTPPPKGVAVDDIFGEGEEPF